jgi:hypothetical protein
MDEWEMPLEETDEFGSRGQNRTTTADPGWKDELNLAEFPIAALTDRIPHGQTTLVFEDRLERRDSPPIVRRLTIMGTHKHGLPTSLDDEVLVGLIQLTKRRSNFTDQRVPFSRYELIELLGWPRSGQSYRRIEEALHRWVGVVLMYENAWWDNIAKSWVDEQFHVLDNVTLYDRERWRTSGRAARAGKLDKPTPGNRSGKPPLPLSSFRWNEVIFQSFQSGNLKQLDLEFYLKLRLPTTKRMYRFLDKRFYRRTRLDFDLRTLACEHIGLSRSYAPTELKRRLKPALEELEQLGFLDPLNPEERYAFVKRGCWRIIFVRGRRDNADGSTDSEGLAPAAIELLAALKARGVTPKSAHDLVANHDLALVRAKIDVFDWLLENDDKRVGKNPAGYLVASIRADYQPPVDYRIQTTQAKVIEDRANKAQVADTRRQAENTLSAQNELARDARLRTAWDALPESERDLIRSTVRAENPGLGRWKNLLEPLYLSALETRLASAEATPGQRLLFPETEIEPPA